MKPVSFISMMLMASSLNAADFTLTSPDGRVVADIAKDMSYSVSINSYDILDGMAAIQPSGNHGKFSLSAPKKGSVARMVASPFYRNDSIFDNYNELTFKAAKDWKLQFRAYNDGVAYRWIYTGRKPVEVVNEAVDFNFAGNPRCFVPFVRTDKTDDFESQFFNSFENVYTEAPLDRLDPRRLAFLPLYVESGDSVKVVITESDVRSYPGLFLNHSGGSKLNGVFAPVPKELKAGGYLGIQKLVTSRQPYIAELDGSRSLPWRVIMVGENDASIAENQLSYLLAEPSRVADISWIKPGKVAWDWWNDWNITGVDFKSGVNNDTYKHYIDFAAENGIEYIIMDDGWSVKSSGDLFSVIPEIDLKELIAYGRQKNVGIILWAGYLPFEKDMEKVCRHYSDMGIKGFKVDFLDRNDQMMQAFEQRAAETCARYGLLLDLHGTHMPGGMNRTWPNVLNFEGVNGMENLKWSSDTLDLLKYDVTIPFTRQLAGPMDYTQGAMRNATKAKYHPSNSEPVSQGTRAHQVGLYMVFDSPLTMLCDSPSAYKHEQPTTDYITSIPTVWDETRVLSGKIGEYVITARRSGNDWYIGGITDWTPRDLDIDFSFLPAGMNYKATWFVDGANAHRNANDYKIFTETITNKTITTVHLAPGGGFAVKVSE